MCVGVGGGNGDEITCLFLQKFSASAQKNRAPQLPVSGRTAPQQAGEQAATDVPKHVSIPSHFAESYTYICQLALFSLLFALSSY
jgi:hypothetical protein